MKNRLLQEQGSISHELRHLTEENPLTVEQRASGKIPEWEEESSEMMEADKINENIKLLEERLKDTQDALKRIELGTYGKCESCGGEIEAARLEANPSARYDLGHEEKISEQEEK